MMEMGECEICNRYRQAKHKGEQLEILAELNEVPRRKIIGILLENGENVKLPIRTRGRKRNTDFTEKEYQKACLIDSMNWTVKFLIVKMNSKIYALFFLELGSIEMKRKEN